MTCMIILFNVYIQGFFYCNDQIFFVISFGPKWTASTSNALHFLTIKTEIDMNSKLKEIFH